MNIGIAGAGLMGRLMAWQLLRHGHQVTLFDKDTISAELSAAKVAAAMLAPFSEAVSSEREVFDWGLESLQMWPELIRQLHTDSGNDTLFQYRGSVVVAHPQDQSNLAHFNQTLRAQVGKEFEGVIETLDQPALKALEPSLAPTFRHATYLHDEASLDNWRLLENLAIAIQSMGGQWQTQVSVDAVEPGVIQVGNDCIHFDWVLDTCGFGAKKRLADLRGVRGEVLWVKAPEVSISRPVRLMHPRYQLYIVPKPENMFVIGATEIESESLAPITVRSSLELQSALYSVHSGFAEAHILRAYANCRPAYMNNLPRVDITAGQLTINGLYRHGYLLGPIVARAAMNALNAIDDPALVFRQ